MATFQIGDHQLPMRYPTAVAIGASGAMFVVDGTHNRIIAFDASGTSWRVLENFDGQRLSGPVGIRLDHSGNLWIADSGNHRILVATPTGERVETIELPGSDAGLSDPTDLALAADEKSIWVVDNDRHRLLKRDRTAGTWQVIGAVGESLGQFQYPFSIAVATSGDVYVSDVINARIQLLGPDGVGVRSIGEFGVEMGSMFRPAGVALDGHGNLWVADTVLGVIQIFRADGGPIDALRDESGKPLRLEQPIGLAFDSAGALYVVESAAGRVRKFAIASATDAAAARYQATPKPPRMGNASRACATCHISWAFPFSEGHDSSLAAQPSNRPEDPSAAREEMCLSCHNGLVADSRSRVWDHHGHRTGIEPPPEISVPQHLPLVDGKLACRTCHSAHGSAAGQGDIRKAVMLRVPNSSSELCISCHDDKKRGPRFGTHPTGGMPWPVPETLIAAGAKVGANPRELTCQVCHTPHGAASDHLLVMGTSSNELCMNCHDQMRPGMFREGLEHPLSPHTTAEQQQAIRDMGTKAGPAGQLICLSCHKLHNGRAERFLLADTLIDGAMCIRCHSERTDILGSSHDLRSSFPNERNRLGLTPTDGGPCSACHLFHRYARDSTPTPQDASGKCATCHQADRCAQAKALPDHNHPDVGCTACHNPHHPGAGSFLASAPETLCTGCHTERLSVIGAGHDAREWSADDRLRAGVGTSSACLSSAAALDRCLVCHSPHADSPAGRFRLSGGEVSDADAICLRCHADAAWHAQSPFAAQHPRGVSASSFGSGLPLSPGLGGTALMRCATCHDPHAGHQNAAALLRAPANRPEQLCGQCHSQAMTIAHTPHGKASFVGNPTALNDDRSLAACGPCHQLHAAKSNLAPHLLAAPGLFASAASPTQQLEHRDPTIRSGGPQSGAASEASGLQMAKSGASATCTACHSSGSLARPPLIATHPDVALFDPLYGAGADRAGTTSESRLMLFDASGREAACGEITCLTCHVPHGRADAAALTMPASASSLRAAEPSGASPLRLLVRPFAAPNVCTTCHGEDARRRFLYFHDPQRRK